MTGVWVGVDPGAKDTGIILRHALDLLLSAVVTNRDYQTGDPAEVTARYLASVVAQVSDFTTHDLTTRIAVEGVRKPCPHLGVTNPDAILGAAIVLGAILGCYPDAVVVPPGGNGSNPLRTYPRGLVTPSEVRSADRRKGWGKPAGQSSSMRHARSAWDVSLAGPACAGIIRVGRGTSASEVNR